METEFFFPAIKERKKKYNLWHVVKSPCCEDHEASEVCDSVESSQRDKKSFSFTG